MVTKAKEILGIKIESLGRDISDIDDHVEFLKEKRDALYSCYVAMSNAFTALQEINDEEI